MDDLVSRQDVIDALMNDADWADAIPTIKSLPSAEPNLMDDGTLEVTVHDARLVGRVLIGDEKHWGGLYYPDAEPKTGRWIRKEKEINDCDGHRAYYWYECDNCGARPPKDQWGQEWNSDFCPNCGAKMEGGDSE